VVLVLLLWLDRTGAVRAAGPADPLPVRGWLVHSPDRAYLERVLKAAEGYRINHLELSHDVIMNADQIPASAERARLIEEVAAAAAKRGIKTYIWGHELNVRGADPELDPGSDAGRAFWEGRRAAYEQALTRCPSLAGVVLMFGSSPTEVWDLPGRDAFWKDLPMPGRVRFVTDQVRAGVVTKARKELFVRDFNHGPRQLAWLTEALRDCPDVTVVSKAEPQDFQPFYPHSPSIGAVGKTAQILEIDLNGEYWGQSLVPVSQVEYLRYRLRHGAGQKVRGAVGRIDTGSNAALGTPGEINLFAFSRLLEDPEASEQTIYDEWLEKRYGLKPETEAARTLQSILTRTFPMAKKMYYTRGFWAWKDLSRVPASAAIIDRGIISKSNALWDPGQKDLEKRLVRPDEDLVREVLAEKEEAVVLADENVRALPALREHLAPEDYRDLKRRLDLTADLARVYRAVASAYWRVKLAGTAPRATAASPEACDTALKALDEWADKLEGRYVEWKAVAEQAPRLRSLASDLRKQRPQPE
jgi:hypothetical protein